MSDKNARLDSEQLREAGAKLKAMFENCGEAIQIVLTACTTGEPDESIRPVFLKQIMGVFQTQKSQMDGQTENMTKLSRLIEQYIEDHAAAAAGY
jgi:hypothetical protein